MLSSSSLNILQSIYERLVAHEEIFLITVLSTWGSSPRPPGSMMVWSEKSGVIGSVSGGCVEDDLIKRLLAREFDGSLPCEIPYGGEADAQGEIRLPCGGILKVLIENVLPCDLSEWKAIRDYVAERQGVSRCICRASGAWRFVVSQSHSLKSSDTHLQVYMGPTRKLLIIGANQTSFYLANYASSLDFDVTICDPSDSLSDLWQTEAFEFVGIYPDGLIDDRFSDSNSAIVAVSHDPRLDDMALLEALPSDAFYVGVMGSQKTTVARLKRLRELDVTSAQIERLHAPIGLDIGSKTPAEIAISIAAQLVKCYGH
ncbi:XdhC family protein [Teredinibacter purpureus]|uniref:XdhC family protein n=1 Tax=Teredinibacter purpureus TaxID=2731756 RepID=UPI0005F89875|nr:XdhC family protein [Teredinibacter purpureus]